MPITLMAPAEVRPPVDEWGVYDPQQAGFAALFARLRAGRTASVKTPEKPASGLPSPP